MSLGLAKAAVGLACLALFAPLYAQSSQIGVSLTAYAGRVWRHTPKLTTRTGEWLAGQEAAIRWQTRGAEAWQAWHRYPVFGAALGRFALGAGNHGAAAYVMPFLDLPLWRSRRFDTKFRLGTGLAWIERPYDSFSNPGQNALGSHVNNVTQFCLGAVWRAGTHWHVSAGGALLHFSNGGSTVPNFGVNLPAVYGGVTYWPEPFVPATWTPAQISKRAARRWGVWLAVGGTWVEFEVPDGPKYFIPHASAAALYRVNRVNRLLAGVDYEFSYAAYRWGLFTAQYENESEARRGSTRLGVFVADEFRFGPLGIELRIGRYVGRAYNDFVLARTYRKLGVRYYLPSWLGSRGPRLFAGIVLKDHQFVAEYIAAQAGIGF
jgi:hypothetical protein